MANFFQRAKENVENSKFVPEDNHCIWHLGTTLNDRCQENKHEEYDYCLKHLREMIENNQSQFIKEFSDMPFVYRSAEERRLMGR